MRKSSFSGYFAEAGVNALNGSGGIHYAAYSTAIMKKLLHMHPVSFPYTNGSRILFPIFLEPVKFDNGRFEIDGTINFLKLGCKSFVILGRNVLDGIADKVEGLKRVILPSFGLIQHTVSDVGNTFSRQAE